MCVCKAPGIGKCLVFHLKIPICTVFNGWKIKNAFKLFVWLTAFAKVYGRTNQIHSYNFVILYRKVYINLS